MGLISIVVIIFFLDVQQTKLVDQQRFSENLQGKTRSQGNITKLEGIDFAQFEYPEGATGQQGGPSVGGKKGGRLHGNPRYI